MGHSVARVQKVQKVQRVQRVAVAADAADYKKGGRGWRSRIEGISAAGRSFSRLFTKPYDTESQSCNADFILIAQEGDTTTLGAKGPVKRKNPLARKGQSILRTFLPAPLSASEHNLPPAGGHNPRAKGPSTLTP